MGDGILGFIYKIQGETGFEDLREDNMELIYDYMRDDVLRHKLDDLTYRTFGFDFEDWMAGGYFEGDYLPYSFIEGGKILANVSANKMNFLQNGVCRNYIQLGTVMTDEAYRKRGLAGKLVEHIIKEYEGKCDGFYLFSNLDALGFYRKMGFKECFQYQYSLKKDFYESTKKDAVFKKADGQDLRIKQKYMDAVRNCAVNTAFEQINKYGLQMFYTAALCDVYYAEDIDCFAVMEKSDDVLLLQSIISRRHVSMKEIVSHIGSEYSFLKLGFTPCAEDAHMFEASVYDGGD